MSPHDLILARLWAMLTEVERDAIEEVFAEGSDAIEARQGLDKLADDWIESLYKELKHKGKNA